MNGLILFGIILVLVMLAWLDHENAKRHDSLWNDIRNNGTINTSDLSNFGIATIVAVVVLVGGFIVMRQTGMRM